MRLISRYAVSLLATCSLVSARALTPRDISLDTLWTVAKGTTNGGCDNFRAILEQWNDESGDLISNAVESLDLYSSDEVVRAAVQSFFNISPSKADSTEPGNANQFKKLKDNFIHDFNFFNGQPVDGGNGDIIKPGLYCDSNWATEVSGGKDATALDIEGKEIWIDDQPQTIRKLYGTVMRGNKVPAWSDLMKCYEFAKSEDVGMYCTNNPKSKGATSDVLYTKGTDAYNRNKFPALSIVMLCPYAFSAPEDIDKLPEDQHAMKDHKGNAIAEGTLLKDVLPRSSTLLHESFHALNGATFESKNEKYGVADCLALTQSKSMKNPENYVLFAVAMWYREKGGWNFSKGTAVKIV